MKAFAKLLPLLTLASCAGVTDGNIKREAVGLWREDFLTFHAIILRQEDGTYRQKITKPAVYGGEPASFEISGRWTISGNKYKFEMETVSTPLWEKSIGKWRSVQILSLGNGVFSHLSTDGAKVDEHRIGEASTEAFNNSVVVPIH